MNTRFSRRLYEQYPYGAEYGCAITAFERKAGQTAVYIALAIGAVAVACALYFN
jgi:hypothetical protein